MRVPARGVLGRFVQAFVGADERVVRVSFRLTGMSVGVGDDGGFDNRAATFFQRARCEKLDPGSPGIWVVETAEDEDAETLRCVADTERVLEEHLGFADGQHAKDPRYAKEDQDCHGALHLQYK